MVGKTKQFETRKTKVRKVEEIKLPPRTESIVKLPVTPGSPLVGVIDKCEIREGVTIAASLTKVVDGYVMTSILNTNDNEVEVQEPLVELGRGRSGADIGRYGGRPTSAELAQSFQTSWKARAWSQYNRPCRPITTDVGDRSNSIQFVFFGRL